MTCAACSSRIETVLNKIPGVTAQVSLLEHRARVTGLSVDDAIAAVRRAGYDAWPASPRTENMADPQAQSGLEKFRLWGSLVALVIMIIEMAAMFIGYHDIIPVAMQLLLATLMQTVVAWPFYRSALRALRARSANMGTLISLGTLSAYGWSVALLIWPSLTDGLSVHRALYFETSVVVLAMVRIGRHLEQKARGQALEALSKLIHLDQSPVLALNAATHEWSRIAPDLITQGMLVRIGPNQPISVDAVIEAGNTEVDESSMTGESMPVAKTPGANIYAGCLNLTGEITAKVTSDFSQSRRAQIGQRILSALSSRAPIAAIADRIAAVFVPVVLVIAVLTLAGHLLSASSLSHAISPAVAVLVVACPCALGLATPAAIAAGLARAAQQGWLFRSADALQRGADIDHVVFDKTGTLTSGRPTLIAIADNEQGSVRVFDLEHLSTRPWPYWLAAASTAERSIEHPLAGALLSYAAGKPMPKCIEVQNHPGQGVAAKIDGEPPVTVLVGKPEWILSASGQQKMAATTILDLDSRFPDATAIDVAINNEWQGRLWVADSLRPDAQAALQLLTGHQIGAVILSGDRSSAVSRVSRLLEGIGFIGEQSPEAKALQLDQWKTQGQHVAMVGDGINDASAMAHAHLGIAMASGATLALQTADVTISDKTPLLGAAQSIVLAQVVMRRVKENLAFAFGFNILAIPLAASGVLSPVIAGSAMALSSAAVMLNAARILNWKPIKQRST